MALFGDTEYATPGYLCAMRDAHRKPAQGIVPPAVTWHLAFNRDAEYVSSDDDWIERVELLVIEIFYELVEHDALVQQQLRSQRDRQKEAQADGGISRAQPECVGNVAISNLCNSPVSARHTDGGWNLPSPLRLLRHSYEINSTSVKRRCPLDPEGSRYETVVIEAYWMSLKLHMRIEMFDEYFTISTTISLRSSDRLEGAKNSFFCKAFDEIVTAIEEQGESVRTNGGLNTMKSKLNGVDTLYEIIWHQFSNDIFAKPFSTPVNNARYSDESEGQRPVLRQLRAKPIGRELFVDFRGIIFELNERPKPYGSSYRRAVSDPNTQRVVSHEEWLNAKTTAFNEAEGRRRADEMLSVLYAAQPVDDMAPPPFEATEYTFSTLNKNRCLFGTSFGWPQSKKPAPLLYVLLFSHDNFREIGLTVNVLHLLGTLRLSALRDFERIIRQSNKIERLDQEYQILHKAMVEGDKGVSEWQQRAAKEASDLATDLARTFKASFPYKSAFGEFNSEATQRYSKLFENAITTIKEAASQPAKSKKARFWAKDGKERCERALQDLEEECKQLQNILNLRLDALSKKEPAAWQERSALKSLLSKCSTFLRRLDLLIDCCSPKDLRSKVIAQIDEALSSMDDGVRSGLSIRSDQAQLSMKRFVSLRQTLDIADIIGFQPYDRFVQQRLERSFNLILTVGTRYRRLTEKMQKLKKAIDEEIRMEELLKLQMGAEVLTIAIIAPHYLATFLEAALEATAKAFGYEVSPIGKPLAVLVSYSIGFGFAYYRFRHGQHKIDMIQRATFA